MVDKEADVKKRSSVVAIAQAGGRLQAVELSGILSQLEILWTQSGKEAQTNWKEFASDCGLATDSVEQGEGSSVKKVVAGFGSAGVVFNRIEVPAAARADMESIVRLQAESRLPLSAEQMELAWRAGHATNGQLPVTMVAARTDHLRIFVDRVKVVSPAGIMLDAEGIVKVWRTFFGGDDGVAVVLSVGAKNSQLCLAEGGRLVNAVVLDMGVDDFSAGRIQTEASERFVRDVRSLLKMFGYSDPRELRVVVLSDGDDRLEAMSGALVSAGLNARAVEADISSISEGDRLDAKTVYDYRLPIGLGLIALEARGDELDIFKRLYSPARKVEKKKGLSSLARSAVLATIMLVVLLVVSYAVDSAKPGAIDKAVMKALADKEDGKLDMKDLIARKELREKIATARPDMLHMIKLVNDIAAGKIEGQEAGNNTGRGGTRPQESGNDSGRSRGGPQESGNDSGGSRGGPRESGNDSGGSRGGPQGGSRSGPNSGIKLQEINFKKGSLTSVSGEATAEAQVHKFEKDLNASKYIKDAKMLPNMKQDAKTKKYSFTIEFKYKTFNEKKTTRR